MRVVTCGRSASDFQHSPVFIWTLNLLTPRLCLSVLMRSQGLAPDQLNQYRGEMCRSQNALLYLPRWLSAPRALLITCVVLSRFRNDPFSAESRRGDVMLARENEKKKRETNITKTFGVVWTLGTSFSSGGKHSTTNDVFFSPQYCDHSCCG